MIADVIELLWRQAEPDVFITREEFVQGLEGWEIEPVLVDGEIMGAFVTKGPALHFSIFHATRPITMKTIRPRLEAIIAEHGFVTTRTPKDAVRQHRFNRLMGFTPVGEDEFFVHYRLEAIRHG